MLDYKLDYDPVYDEQDWLKTNNIHSITLDFVAETFYVMDNEDICVPRKVLLEFIALQ